MDILNSNNWITGISIRIRDSIRFMYNHYYGSTTPVFEVVLIKNEQPRK
ncbi:hypothetical protein LCGC14_1068820 [marine sediment metagenome]|uniref:Uncharacterized protein n=1 Tax=marine sediment metagenome TaxID=412755 RepID=A0A0F9QPS6_9ZZZZ